MTKKKLTLSEYAANTLYSAASNVNMLSNNQLFAYKRMSHDIRDDYAKGYLKKTSYKRVEPFLWKRPSKGLI